MADKKKLINLEALEQLAIALKNKLNSGSVKTSVYKPAGSLDSPDVSKLSEEYLGNVYNIKQPFDTDGEHFVEGAGKHYSEGTNVAVVEYDPGVYKFDVQSGFVDLSEYSKTSAVQTMIDSTIENEIVSTEEVEAMLKSVFSE